MKHHHISQILTTRAYSRILMVGLIGFFAVSLPSRAQKIISLEVDDWAFDNAFIHLDGDLNVLASTVFDSPGAIISVTIPSDGSSITQEDILIHAAFADHAALVKLDASTVALAHQRNAGMGLEGVIKTFDVAMDGTITELQEHVYSAVEIGGTAFTHVTGTIYTLAYTTVNLKCIVATFDIAADGSSISPVQSLEHDTPSLLPSAQYDAMISLDTDTFVLAFTGPDGDGFLKTFTISADGTMISEAASLEFDTADSEQHTLFQIDANTVALAYSGPDDDGFLKTFDIPADGSSITPINTLEFNTTLALYPSLIRVDGDTYVLLYGITSQNGQLATFDISTDGTIISSLETLDIATEVNLYNRIIQVSPGVFSVVSWSGSGFISTWNISSTGVLPVSLSRFSIE